MAPPESSFGRSAITPLARRRRNTTSAPTRIAVPARSRIDQTARVNGAWFCERCSRKKGQFSEHAERHRLWSAPLPHTKSGKPASNRPSTATAGLSPEGRSHHWLPAGILVTDVIRRIDASPKQPQSRGVFHENIPAMRTAAHQSSSSIGMRVSRRPIHRSAAFAQVLRFFMVGRHDLTRAFMRTSSMVATGMILSSSRTCPGMSSRSRTFSFGMRTVLSPAR